MALVDRLGSALRPALVHFLACFVHFSVPHLTPHPKHLGMLVVRSSPQKER